MGYSRGARYADERKRKQVESAAKKSSRAKLLKLADKASNLRTIAAIRLVDKTQARIRGVGAISGRRSSGRQPVA
jgi:(p)ppGpp synthase/HD superfamily hydrolase